MKVFVTLSCLIALLAKESASQGRVVGGPPPRPSNVVPANPTNNVLLPVNPQDPALSPASLNDRLNEISNEIDIDMANKVESAEPGIIDSVLGEGTQSRIVASVNNWVANKAKANPGCVQRFVCETYRTGETMNGFPYLLMSLTNAAVSFYVAEIFDQSIDIKEITGAAKLGRTVGSCHNMQCPAMDGQLRTLGDFLTSAEDFFSSVFTSLSSTVGK